MKHSQVVIFEDELSFLGSHVTQLGLNDKRGPSFDVFVVFRLICGMFGSSLTLRPLSGKLLKRHINQNGNIPALTNALEQELKA